MKSEITPKVLFPIEYKHLLPTKIITVVESYTTATWDLLKKEGSRLEGISTPLRDFVLPAFYEPSVYAFFGRSYPVAELYEPFNDFDGSFHLSIAGLPRVFLKKSTEGLATMHRLLGKYIDGSHDDASEGVLEIEQVMRSHGYVCPCPFSTGNFGTDCM